MTSAVDCQAGYLPIPLASIPSDCLTDFDIYIRNDAQEYHLYRAVGIPFTISERDRLLANDIHFAYVSTADQNAYYHTVERHMGKIINSPDITYKEKCELIYSTCTQLSGELMDTPPQESEIQRTTNLAQSIVELVLQDKKAFSHLFEISAHDCYTTTHLVNTCNYAISLAHHMGITDKTFLQNLTLSALVHDIGKMFIPSEILNTTKKLTEQEYALIAEHVNLGYNHLKKIATIPEESLRIVLEHHERIDGSGYPQGLMADEISIGGKIIAVIDTFDAMTSVRPYRSTTYSVEKTLDILTQEAPEKFDRDVVELFVEMIQNELLSGNKEWAVPENADKGSYGVARRQHQRHFFRKVAIMHVVKKVKGQLKLGDKEKITIHNMSRSGMGFITSANLSHDDNVCIVIPGSEDQEPVKLVAVVMHSMKHDDGWNTIGAKFYRLQSARILEALAEKEAQTGQNRSE